MTTTTLPMTRKKAPCNAEWDRIRPEFERLYIHEGTSLPKISAILAQDHGFYAKPYMYKVRIAKWGLKKNFTLEDLEAAASTVSHFIRAGLKAPQPIIDRRKVPISRAKRHFGAFFKCDNAKHAGGIATSRGEQPPHDCSPLPEKRKTSTRHAVRRRPRTVPRVLLQQSAECHLVESTLAAVNNYFGWRFIQSEDHFIVREAGDHVMPLKVLSPNVAFNEVFSALDNGALHALKASIPDLRAQMDMLLLQQHSRLIESLINYNDTDNFGEDACRLRSRIFSYLNIQASKFLGPNHPISLTLEMLTCQEERKGCSLVLALMCDIARRQEESHPEAVFELECTTVKFSFREDDLDTSTKLCQTLSQRYMEKYNESHIFCRRLLYLLGGLKYQHNVNDVAQKFLLRVIELDDPQDPDRTSIFAMEMLGWMYRENEDFHTTEEWLSRAYEASCKIPDASFVITQSLKSQLDLVQRQLKAGQDISEPSEMDLGEEDKAEILEELCTEFARMDLPETTDVEFLVPWDPDLGSLSTNNVATVYQGGQQGMGLMEKVVLGTIDGLQDATQQYSMSHVATIKPPVVDDEQNGHEYVGPGQTLRRVQSTQSVFSAQSHGDIPGGHGHGHSASVRTHTTQPEISSTITIEQDMADVEQPLQPARTNDAHHHREDDCINSFDDTFGDSFDDIFDLYPMDLDVQDSEWANEDSLERPVASLPLADTSLTLAMPPSFSDFESYVGPDPIMNDYELANSGNAWTLDGDLDTGPIDFEMFGDLGTIDPKLIFSQPRCN